MSKEGQADREKAVRDALWNENKRNNSDGGKNEDNNEYLQNNNNNNNNNFMQDTMPYGMYGMYGFPSSASQFTQIGKYMLFGFLTRSTIGLPKYGCHFVFFCLPQDFIGTV